MKKTRSDNIRGYRIDYACNTVYLNYTFAAKAQRDYLSPEAIRLREIQESFPSFSVVVKAGRTITTPRPTKRLKYVNMEAYISTQANADELLAQFELTKKQSKLAPSPYKYVREWFEASFPKYRESAIFKDEKEPTPFPKASNL